MPGNAVVSVPTRMNVLATSGVATVNAAISAASTSYQDQSLIDTDNGKDFTYYLFAVDSQGNVNALLRIKPERWVPTLDSEHHSLEKFTNPKNGENNI